MTEPREPDCDYLYFKPGGKWKYSGEGFFPDGCLGRPITRFDIQQAQPPPEAAYNLPGLSPGDHNDLLIIITPRENCEVEGAFPCLIHAKDTVLPWSIGDTVFFMRDDKITSAKIRAVVVTLSPASSRTAYTFEVRNKYFDLNANDVFLSDDALTDSLKSKIQK